MIVSMTGYGQSFLELDHFRITVEVKSINHRFSEINIRMPRQYLLIEDRLKKIINQYVQRGKVDVFISVEGEGLIERGIEVDWSLLQDFYNLHEKVQLNYGLKETFPVDKFLQHPDIVSVKEKEIQTETLFQQMMDVTKAATLQLVHMRKQEGQALSNDLEARVKKMVEITLEVAEHAPKVVTMYRERLQKRIEEFLSGTIELDTTRLVTEVALFADKANIDEELTRLQSHYEQFSTIINQHTGAVGRKLDFLVQEMNREINTIGSKANDVHISQLVVELKAELEKIKEQVQNIE